MLLSSRGSTNHSVYGNTSKLFISLNRNVGAKGIAKYLPVPWPGACSATRQAEPCDGGGFAGSLKQQVSAGSKELPQVSGSVPQALCCTVPGCSASRLQRARANPGRSLAK